MYKGTVAVAGECMCTRPFSMRREPEFLEMLKILREADTAYCHLEMNIFEPGNGAYPAKAYAPSALQADPIVAKDLKWAGIDLCSAAYNHVMDWGIPGMVGTMESLDKAGIVHAGLGNNLEEAREPAYFESPAGRVAIISISSGHGPNDSASSAKPPVPGRPGVNPLRVDQKFVVGKEHLEHLKQMWKDLGLETKNRWFLHPEEGDVCFNIGDFGGGGGGQLVVRPGNENKIVSNPNEWDVEGNLRAIRDARRQADLVLVAHHAAVNDGRRGLKPMSIVPPFAKQCIDAGADVFIGHGWHRALPIEIYKNRPIFYGTGNFFAQSQFLKRFPADTFEGHGFSPDEIQKATPSDLHEKRERHMGHWKEQPWGAIAVFEMEGGKLGEIKLYPYTTGYGFDPQGSHSREETGKGYRFDSKGTNVRETANRIEGRPMLADKEDGKNIIGYLKGLSEPYHTRIEYKDGIGVIKVK
jgi:poly-gamma-glutamate capsule biosynthesis protein CapA/YwtB (metallophosphatase superfamily)